MNGASLSGSQPGEARPDGPLLDVREVTVAFPGPGGMVPVVTDVSFSVRAGETVGLVGESGSGKTVTAMAALGLTKSQGGRVTHGSVMFEGQELTAMRERDLARIRGNRVGMIFQQPIRSLNPAFTVGEHRRKPIVFRGRINVISRFTKSMRKRINAPSNVINNRYARAKSD